MNLLKVSEETSKKLWNLATRFRAFPEITPPAPDFGSKYEIPPLFPQNIRHYTLELGPGWGEVALELALANPEQGFVLMEKNPNRFRAIARAIRQHALQSIVPLSINFQWFLEDLFLKDSFHRVLVNFPDPWPKKRHRKNRLVNIPFFESLNQILKPGGEFHFATDHGPYARQVIRILRSEVGEKLFQKISINWTTQRTEIPVSVFERERREAGCRIYYIHCIKK